LFLIETARLLLRPFAPTDASAVQRLVGDWNVAKFLALVPHPYPAGLAAKWISTHGPLAEDGAEYTFAITRKPAGDLIGAISLTPRPGKYGAIGYWLSHDHWGQGYATEAVQCVEALAFDWLDLPQLSTVTRKNNLASQRVLEKSHFRQTGYIHLRFRDEPALQPFVTYRVAREAWRSARNGS